MMGHLVAGNLSSSWQQQEKATVFISTCEVVQSLLKIYGSNPESWTRQLFCLVYTERVLFMLCYLDVTSVSECVHIETGLPTLLLWTDATPGDFTLQHFWFSICIHFSKTRKALHKHYNRNPYKQFFKAAEKQLFAQGPPWVKNWAM